jgi:hypothetical protein
MKKSGVKWHSLFALRAKKTSNISFKKFKTMRKVLYKMFINPKKVDLGQESALKSSLSMIANIK